MKPAAAIAFADWRRIRGAVARGERLAPEDSKKLDAAFGEFERGTMSFSRALGLPDNFRTGMRNERRDAAFREAAEHLEALGRCPSRRGRGAARALRKELTQRKDSPNRPDDPLTAAVVELGDDDVPSEHLIRAVIDSG